MAVKIAVTTRSFTSARDGANLFEPTLTPAAVRTHGLARLRTLQTTGDARGAEAQPLVVPGVVDPRTKKTRELVIVATMANSVEAFDAETGERVWRAVLGLPIRGTRAIDAYLINDRWGILSTPVYDAVSGRVYAVAWSSPDMTPAQSKFHLVGISVATGNLAAVVDLSGATYDPGNGIPVQRFSAAARKQRAALLLDRGLLYAGFGTIAETSSTAQGWVIAVNIVLSKIQGAWTTTAPAGGAGIWMAGQGLSADADGFVYAMTGNGAFDGKNNFGESFVKLGWVGGHLACVDHFTPWADLSREGKDPVTGAREDDGPAKPTNVRSYGAMSMGGYDDMDLGSGGALVVEALDLVLGAGKDGILYPVRKSNMGRTRPEELRVPQTNYGALASPAIFFTYYPGPTPSPMPADVRDLNFLFGGKTHHQHSTPVYWRSDRLGHMLFTQGENGPVRSWTIDPKTKAVRFLATANEIASVNCVRSPGGMPGGMMTLSANGGKDGVLWVSMPYGDGNMTVTNGRLVAYDAETLEKLWDSERWGLAYVYNKFNVPLAANGRLYVPNYSGGIDVYGLA